MNRALVQFCTNGHDLTVRDQSYGHRANRDFILGTQADWEKRNRQPYCTKCGAPTLSVCETCKTRIRDGRRPSYCGQCGKPFPWTETALEAAKAYADELNLTFDEKSALQVTMNDLTADTPRTELAAHRFKKVLSKIGPVAGEALKSIIVNFATEAAKKLIEARF